MFELRRITKSFGGVHVLDDISIVLKPGDRVGLSGGNGTGKSTLINIATGFLAPSSGQILLDGHSLNDQPPWKYARAGIRRSFQTSRLVPTLTVRDQFRFETCDPARRRQLVAHSALEDVLDLFPFQVPLPVLRKIEVVRALLADPRVLFLDEPSAGLSGEELSAFARFLSRNVSGDAALLIVEHRQDLMRVLVDEIVTLEGHVPSVATAGKPAEAVGDA